jgi:hypothetical protein
VAKAEGTLGELKKSIGELEKEYAEATDPIKRMQLGEMLTYNRLQAGHLEGAI